MKSKRSIIRAILFIVRMQRASAHTLRHSSYAFSRFQRTRQQQTDQQQQPQQQRLHRGQKLHPQRLKRCESTRGRLPIKLKYGGKHRNSAPTALLTRTPTPQIEIRLLDCEECNFSSYSRMMQPYTLRLERSSSSGSSGSAVGAISTPGSSASLPSTSFAASNRMPNAQSKSQLTLHTTMAHHLASKLLLQKQPSLDDRTISNVDSLATELGKFVRRQGSVEGSDKKKHLKPPNVQIVRPERKVKHSMINLFGALTAVEQGDLDSLRVILSKNCFALNVILEYGLYSYFSVPLTLLDVALMLDRSSAAALLLKHGATENPELADIDRRRKIVSTVLCGSFDRLKALREKQSFTKEDEKRISLLESQIGTVKKMKTVLDQDAQLPGPPTNVRAFVSSGSRATVEFATPQYPGSSIVLKYKVEWSKSPNFEEVEGNLEVTDMRKTKISIENLEHGGTFSFRICAASIFGFGDFALASPKTLRISSWEDVDETPNFRVQQMQNVAELFEQVEKHRQSTVWQRVFPQNVETGVKKKKSGIRYLFSASSKFVKNIQRGVYLASIIYTESKVLCTVDDCLPVLCVDENCSSVSTDDLHWLMKLSLCWDQVPYLLESMNGTSYSNSSQLRAKLLEAITSMMNALGVRDIGRVHHVPLTFSNGVTFIVSVNLVNENQTVQGLAMRWMRMEKLARKKNSACSALDFLNKEFFNILNFFESSQIPLDAGLYLCYLRMESSLNVIRVTVPENVPSVLPFALVRANPHVSREEWQWLRQLDSIPCGPSGRPSGINPRPTALQYTFHQQLGRAASVLVHDLEMEPDQIQNHRLFRLQVLQLHSDVSFILIVPKAEDVCHVIPGYGANEDTFSENFKGCVSIPAPVFQMINLFTYQPDFITAYCRLSIFIEHFIMVLQCEQRQCLLENDSKVYMDQLDKLNDFQQRLDAIWRASRWISNFASVARDRQINCAVPLAQIISPPAMSPLQGLGANVDDSADIGYHSDQSTERFASLGAGVGSVVNFKQCNTQMRARLRASKIYDNNAKNNNNHTTTTTTTTTTNNNNSFKKEDVENESDFESAWKGRSRNRRHSEKNIRHASLSGISLRKPSDISMKSEFSITKKKKSSIVSMIQNSLEAKKPHSATLETDRPTAFENEFSEMPTKFGGKNDITCQSVAKYKPPPPPPTSQQISGQQMPKTSTNVHQRTERRPLSMIDSSLPTSSNPFDHVQASTACTSSATTVLTTLTSTTTATTNSDQQQVKEGGEDAGGSSLHGSPSTPLKSSIVRVYVAYECGLESGASVRLKITNETTASEIVALVVEQISKVVGSPPLHVTSHPPESLVNGNVSSEGLEEFCLVSIVGARERRLRDSFPLLRLQSPWNKGKLYVRHVKCISSAVQYGNEAFV